MNLCAMTGAVNQGEGCLLIIAFRVIAYLSKGYNMVNLF